jgi:hypothetical protein
MYRLWKQFKLWRSAVRSKLIGKRRYVKSSLPTGHCGVYLDLPRLPFPLPGTHTHVDTHAHTRTLARTRTHVDARTHTHPHTHTRRAKLEKTLFWLDDMFQARPIAAHAPARAHARTSTHTHTHAHAHTQTTLLEIRKLCGTLRKSSLTVCKPDALYTLGKFVEIQQAL